MVAGSLTPTRPTTRSQRSRGKQRISSPAPMAGETQAQFLLRASRALRQQLPSVNRRTLQILSLWTASTNDRDLRQQAAEQFPADKFVHAGPRCVFVEHIVPASSDGKHPEFKYGQKELQQLVDWANYRIRNAGNFAAISDGHTPSQAEKENGIADPDVLGYAGPFYLGQLGDIDPQWAIYADEWVHKQDLPRFAKLQRRSPEVWASEPIESRTMDPIAALGAATPRLDSGMNPYCRSSDGRMVVRYSAMTFPGPFNTSVPSGEKTKTRPCRGLQVRGTPRKTTECQSPRRLLALPIRSTTKHRYSGDPSMPFPGDDDSKPDLATAIGDALQAVLPSIVQAVCERLTNADGENPPADDDVDHDAADASLDDETDPNTATPDDEDAETHKYARAGSGEGLAVIVARQSREIHKLRQDIIRERRDVRRYSRLQELSREFAFDPREEFELCVDMNDTQFDRHCERTVAKYAHRDEIGYLDLPDAEPARYSGRAARVNPEQIERFSREAASIAARKNAAHSGSTTFEAEFDAICKQHGVTV